MRVNQYLASSTGLGRRTIDDAIKAGRVRINNDLAKLGQDVKDSDSVYLDNELVNELKIHLTILLNKPVGYVCSRDGQGSPTIYNLLPKQYANLKYAGRLDKDSSGLVILTNDGNLLNKLTHPTNSEDKIYQVELNKPLLLKDKLQIETGKIKLDSKPSIMKIKQNKQSNSKIEVTLREGRNRQIRRTFSKVGYEVVNLHRTKIGKYSITDLKNDKFIKI